MLQVRPTCRQNMLQLSICASVNKLVNAGSSALQMAWWFNTVLPMTGLQMVSCMTDVLIHVIILSCIISFMAWLLQTSRNYISTKVRIMKHFYMQTSNMWYTLSDITTFCHELWVVKVKWEYSPLHGIWVLISSMARDFYMSEMKWNPRLYTMWQLLETWSLILSVWAHFSSRHTFPSGTNNAVDVILILY